MTFLTPLAILTEVYSGYLSGKAPVFFSHFLTKNPKHTAIMAAKCGFWASGWKFAGRELKKINTHDI